MSKTVWKFTNQRELSAKEFVDYFERKVFRTVRKYGMLPEDKVIFLKRSGDLNTVVLKEVLSKKFSVKFGKANMSSDNLSQVAEDVFGKIVDGDFDVKVREDAPLLYLSDKEIELYARLKGLKGTTRKVDKDIQGLFGKFLGKNQDLNILIPITINQISIHLKDNN